MAIICVRLGEMDDESQMKGGEVNKLNLRSKSD